MRQFYFLCLAEYSAVLFCLSWSLVLLVIESDRPQLRIQYVHYVNPTA